MFYEAEGCAGVCDEDVAPGGIGRQSDTLSAKVVKGCVTVNFRCGKCVGVEVDGHCEWLGGDDVAAFFHADFYTAPAHVS